MERPSGTYEGDESVPDHGDTDASGNYGSTGELPPQDTGSAIPPYEGRKESAEPLGDSGEPAGARTGGASKPTAAD